MKKVYSANPCFLPNFYVILAVFLLLLWPGILALQAQCNGHIVLNVVGPGVSEWTAPATGGPFLVNITAKGAEGGAYREYNPRRVGGTGASMSGTFLVQNGETLRAIAGEGGYHSQLEGGGGGGGSGAVNCGTTGDCASGTLLILAAAGSGGHQFGANNLGLGYGLGGAATTSGNGLGGNIDDNDSGGGGGGLNSAGQSTGSGGIGGAQVSFSGLSAGGAGSYNKVAYSGNNKGGVGMGGGGGGGDGATVDNASGGGGGHTGGSAGNLVAASSFNAGANQTNIDGVDGAAVFGDTSSPANSGMVTFICLNALPVSLLDFKAVLQKQQVDLHWSTATETNNLGFEMEHSMDGRHWSVLGFAAGQGTTTLRQDYVFKHEKPHFGINYYRLKQLDFDGAFEYSPIVVADLRSLGHDFDIFPNPSIDGALSLRLLHKSEGMAFLEIFDWAGYRVYQEKIQVYAGTQIWPVSMVNFPKGTYTARLKVGNEEVRYQKLVLQ